MFLLCRVFFCLFYILYLRFGLYFTEDLSSGYLLDSCGALSTKQSMCSMLHHIFAPKQQLVVKIFQSSRGV